MLKLLLLIVGTALSAILYRAGGMSQDDTAKPKWIPKWLRHSITRDIGCTIITIGFLLLVYLGLH